MSHRQADDQIGMHVHARLSREIASFPPAFALSCRPLSLGDGFVKV